MAGYDGTLYVYDCFLRQLVYDFRSLHHGIHGINIVVSFKPPFFQLLFSRTATSSDGRMILTAAVDMSIKLIRLTQNGK